MAERQKICSACKVSLPLSDFSYDGSKRDFCSSKCKPCQKTYYAAWRKKNAEKKKQYDADYYKRNREVYQKNAKEYYEWNRDAIREYVAQYVKDNPDRHVYHRRLRRARIAGVIIIPFTPEQLAQRMAYWGNKCWICKGSYEEVDHVKPLSKGGGHFLANFRPICKSCNCSKKATWPLRAVA